MKVKHTKTQALRVEVVSECLRFTTVPGWVWPFECDHCRFDLNQDRPQVVADVDGQIKHYHEECFQRVIVPQEKDGE